MADFTLARPQAGQHIELTPPADARIVLGFPSDEATLERSGDNLVFSFEDGSSVVVTGFYTSYTKETLPEFVIEGQAVSGEQFFAALGEDLMPAAGPSQGAQNADGGRYREYADAALMNGIDRLGGLDLGLNRTEEPERDLDAWGRRDDDWSTDDAGAAGEAANLIPGVIDHYADVAEDDPARNAADGWALTGSVRGDGTHSFTWGGNNHAQYGTFSQNPDGTWVYTLDNANPDVQALGEGETMQEEFTYTYTDENGDSATGKVVITIHGTNDDPTIDAEGSDLAVRVEEAGVLGDKMPGDANAAYNGAAVATGTILAHDVDARDTLSFSIAPGTGVVVDGGATNSGHSITTQYGTLTIDDQGNYTYRLDNNKSAVDTLSQGQRVTESFTVTVSDNHGGTAQQTITVTIEGTNDRPTLAIQGTGQAVAEDETTSVSGTFSVTDVDGDGAFGGQTGGVANQRYSIAGGDGTTGTAADSPSAGGPASFTTDYGTLTINPDGTWNYALNNNSETVQSLGQGQTRTETFNVTVTDVHGSTHTQPITVTITGTNDAPVVDAHTDALTLKEAGVGPDGGDPNAPVAGIPTVTGTVDAHDIDANDPTLSYSLAADADTSIISSATDPDTGVQSIVTPYGTLVLTPGNLTADGKPSYTYTLDQGRADALNAGQTHNETFVLTVADGHGGTTDVPIRVTIEGTNDRPQLKIADAAQSLVEDGEISTVSGTFTVTDADADGAFNGQTDGVGNQRYSIAGGTAADGDVTTGTGTPSPDAGGAATFTTDYGTLTVNPDGTWEYALNNGSDTLHALKEGETRTETFNLTVTDVHGANHTQPITVTITGTNDKPVITPVTEHVKDTGVYGTDDVSPNTPTGDYTGPDADGHIKDAEHRLVVEGKLAGFDAEGASLAYGVITEGIAADGTLTLTNPEDASKTATVKVVSVSTDAAGTTSIVTEAGTFTLGADGSYRFALNTDAGGFVDSMARGEKWNLTFNVTASDGDLTGNSSLTICIEGTNEAPTFTQLAYKDYLGAEQTPVDADGKWVVEAAEQGRWRGNEGDSNRVSDHSDVLTGSFGADDRDNGESVNLTFGAEFKDGATSGGNKDALEELGRMELKGKPEDLVLTEPRPLAEHADKGTTNLTELAAGTYKVFHFDVGDFYLNVNTGDYYFDVNDDSDLVNRMNLGDTHSLNFSVTVTDEHGASASHDFTINITGRNDRPELSVKTGLGITDGDAVVSGDLVADGIVNVADVDLGDSHTFYIVKDPTAGSRNPNRDYEGTKENWASNKLENYQPETELHGKYGTLTINPDGSYTYTLDTEGPGYEAVKNLPKGEALHDEVFHIAVQDSHGAFDIKDITINVTGVNDKPVVNGFNVDVKEDGIETDGRGGMHATDQMHNPDGSENTSHQGWIGNADHKLAAAGNVFTDKGTNGQPIVSDTDTDDKVTVDIAPNLDNANALKFSLTGTVDGVDASELTPELISDKLVDGIRTIVTNYGTLTLNTQTGEYRFELSEEALAKGGVADLLAQGQKLTLSFTLTATDGKGESAHHIMGVNIQGANEAPELSFVDQNQEGGPDLWYGGSGNSGFIDGNVDDDGSVTFQVSEEGYDKGGVSVGSNTYIGTVRGEDIDYGATQEYAVAVGPHGVVLNPVSNDPNAAKDLQAYRDAFTDADKTVEGKYGTLTINPDGQYTYTLNETADKLGLDKDGNPEKGSDTFTIYVRDEHGAWDAQSVTFNVQGSNDKPVVELDTTSITLREDGLHGSTNYVWAAGKSHSGTFTASDVDSTDAVGPFTYEVTPKTPGNYTMSVEGDTVTWTHKATTAGGSNLEEGFFIFTLNTRTGEYTVTLDDSKPGVQAWLENQGTTLHFNVVAKDQHGLASDPKDLTINLKGANDLPELKVVEPHGEVTEDGDKDGNAATSITATGKVQAEEAQDTGDEHRYYVFKQGASNDKTGLENGEYSHEQLLYNEANLDLWMQNNGGAVNVGGNEAQRQNNLFLGKPKADTYDGDKDGDGFSTVEGQYGTLTINVKTGEYTYTLDSSKVEHLGVGDTLTETFSVLAQDTGGAFDIKDVTFTINGSADKILVDTTDAHVVQITEAGVEFNTNTDNTDNTDNNAAQSAGGTFEVTPVDEPVDENGVNHLVYGFKDADGNFHAESVEVTQDGKIYGTLTIDARGNYTFTLADNADVNALNAGELLKLAGYELAVRDDRHPDDMVTSQKLDLYIHGSNDRPYFTVDDEAATDTITVGGLVENDKDKQTISGTLTADDPDAAHNPGDLTFSIESGGKLVQVMEGKYGVLELLKDGSYTYTITKPELLEALNGGQSLIDSALAQEEFSIRVTDPQNAHTSGKLVIDVTGSADNPVITADNLTIWEDNGDIVRPEEGDHTNDPEITGKLALNGRVDAEDKGSVSWSNEGFSGGVSNTPSLNYNGDALGTLSIDPKTGEYTYTLTDNGLDLVQSMNEGQSITQTYKVQAVIEGGKIVDQDITITINGTNDRPILNVTDDASFTGRVQQDVFEDDNTPEQNHPSVIFTGTLDNTFISDVDDATGLRYMLVGKDGPVTELKTSYGTITLSYEEHDGIITTHYKYTLDNESATLDQALKTLQGGQNLTDSAPVVVVDPHGAVSKESHTITITIEGNPDGGSGEGPGHTLVFDDSSVLTGSVAEDGVDMPGTEHMETTVFEGQLYTKWSDDNDDAPTENSPERVFGIADADGNQIQSSAADNTISVEGKYGYLIIDPVTGKYTYTLYNGEDGKPGPVQNLAAGETVTEDFTLMLNGQKVQIDGQDAKIEITIHGTNDAPVITAATEAGIKETGQGGLTSGMTATGTVTATDIDHKIEDGQRVEIGTDKDGNPVYATESVTYYFVDKDGNYVTSMETQYGSIEINADGTYTFHLDVNKLPEDKVQKYPDGIVHLTAVSLKDIVQVVAYDGKDYSEAQDVTVNITGTNYGPEVTASDVTLQVTEDGAVTNGGFLKDLFKDDEGADNLTYTVNGGSVAQGIYGTLQLVDGKYVYTLNNADDAVQGLDADHPGKDSFTITVTDKHGVTNEVTITVNVTGDDDEPVLSVDKVLTVREGDVNDADGNISVSGQATAYDKDAADSVEQGTLKFGLDVPTDADGKPLDGYTVNPDGSVRNQYGTFTVDQNGRYTFTLDNNAEAVRALTSGSLTETSVTLTVTDSQGNVTSQTIKVDITGTNTAPDLNINLEPNTDAPMVENGADGKDSFSDTFTVSDVDGTVAKVAVTEPGSYGKVELVRGENGEWTYTYTLDERAEALGGGEKTTDSFTITVTDAEGATTEKTVTVHLEGTNDDPVITQAPDLNAKEDGREVKGTLDFTDVDVNDEHTFTVKAAEDTSEGHGTDSAAGTYGTLSINGKGEYTYTVTNHELGAGETATDTFTVTVDDGHGGTDTRTITVNIAGTNDAPVIETSVSAEDNTGSLTFSDADLNDSHSLAIRIDGKTYKVDLDAEGKTGTCTIDKLGTFELTRQDSESTEGNRATWTYSFTASQVATAAALLGVVVTQDFQLVVSDGHTQTLTPASGDGSLSVSYTGQNANNTAELSLADWDHTDLSGTLHNAGEVSYAFTGASGGDIQGQFGTLRFDGDTGTYHYELDTSESGLLKLAEARQDGPVKESFEYTYTHGGASQSGALNITLADVHALVGTDGDDTLRGTGHNDLLFGGEGDDQLFGGAGDDLLFGGEGDDFLDGGTGADKLYGGAGNDILVYHKGVASLSGGEGIDFLIGADKNTLDSLFADADDNPVGSDIEVFVTSPNSLSLTSLDDFEKLGITINKDGKLELSDAWKPTHDGTAPDAGQEHAAGNAGQGDGAGQDVGTSLSHIPDGYVEYTYSPADGTDDTTILVQKALLENSNG